MQCSPVTLAAERGGKLGTRTRCLSAILTSTVRRTAYHMVLISWIAIFSSVWTTVDLVIDLVFEEAPEAAGRSQPVDEPDNAAEHILLPSTTTDDSPTVLKWDTGLDPAAVSLVTISTPRLLFERSAQFRLPREAPISFSVPLRI
jgi:hypothetical protein